MQESIVCVLGFSHLLQPPLTAWLGTRVLGLDRAFAGLPPLPARLAHVMALTAVLLPTLLGVLIGTHAVEVLSGGMARWAAFLLAGGLWTPRLVAQLLWVGPLFPPERRHWHWVLTLIFCVQGPGMLVVLACSRS